MTAQSTRTTQRETQLLGAFLLFMGLDLGAGVFEECVVIPRWANATTAADIRAELQHSGHLAAGQRFWPFVGIPTLAFTAANLVAASRCRDRRRPWWRACAYAVAACDVATVGYFVPKLKVLRSGQLPDARARELASRWVTLDRVRLAVGTSAFLAGLVALSRAAGVVRR